MPDKPNPPINTDDPNNPSPNPQPQPRPAISKLKHVPPDPRLDKAYIEWRRAQGRYDR